MVGSRVSFMYVLGSRPSQFKLVGQVTSSISSAVGGSVCVNSSNSTGYNVFGPFLSLLKDLWSMVGGRW